MQKPKAKKLKGKFTKKVSKRFKPMARDRATGEILYTEQISNHKKKSNTPFKMKGPGTKNTKAKIIKNTTPTDREIKLVNLHKKNLKEYPELSKDKFYDKRKKRVADIIKKYPNYKF